MIFLARAALRSRPPPPSALASRPHLPARSFDAPLLARRALATAASTAAAPPFGSPRTAASPFAPLDAFERRHLGPRPSDVQNQLQALGHADLDSFLARAVPDNVRLARADAVDDRKIAPLSESELITRATTIARMNKDVKSLIGLGYHNAVVPQVIMRNLFQNPGWYTSYTAYQPEISQGRLESLINFQTMTKDLTGLEIANASLLDEPTAAAEAMILAFANARSKRKTFLVHQAVLPQTLAVLRQRAKGFGIRIVVADLANVARLPAHADLDRNDLFGVLVQYPDVDGALTSWKALADEVHAAGGLVVAATDLLALTMLVPPGEWGADVAVGNSARFGVPLGYGGPHAAFFATTDKLKRRMPGRLVGLSKDADGDPAYRLALQTREQHIRREKATSNVCTAQALLANMAAMYAVYHGPDGLRRIAAKVHALTRILKDHLEHIGYRVVNRDAFFDTLTIDVAPAGTTARRVLDEANNVGLNLRPFSSPAEEKVGVTLDESVTLEEMTDLFNAFALAKRPDGSSSSSSLPYTPTVLLDSASASMDGASLDTISLPAPFARTSPYLHQAVFNTHKSETEMMRYLQHLQGKDLSLTHAMIPLGSCTMKLNSATSMTPLTWSEFANVHPFAPVDQAEGYQVIIDELTRDLCLITGFPAVSLQPNSGAQGEFTGLSVIRAYHESRGEGARDVCLIPLSAHGTNPASAVMAGLRVVPVKTLPDGNLDLADLRAKAEQHKDKLAAFMLTWPTTYGNFEDSAPEACKIIHDNGGQVYLDGANLQAQIGLTNPATAGADVCHLNLHKTFGIPHGGGGPGVGPIGVAAHLAPFLPSHPIVPTGGSTPIHPVSAAPWGSASILTISWAYIKMLGGSGLTRSSAISILNANYAAHRLRDHYTVRSGNKHGLAAHEFLIDFKEFEKDGLKVMDFAKRLQDFSFHPPTVAWPDQSCMLVEPTESESLAEIDRFCDAMIRIRDEARDVAEGRQPRGNNVIVNSPHPIKVIAADKWDRPYTREQAAYPLPYLRENKFWPTTSRLDDAYGDLNLICECGDVSQYTE